METKRSSEEKATIKKLSGSLQLYFLVHRQPCQHKGNEVYSHWKETGPFGTARAPWLLLVLMAWALEENLGPSCLTSLLGKRSFLLCGWSSQYWRSCPSTPSVTQEWTELIKCTHFSFEKKKKGRNRSIQMMILHFYLKQKRWCTCL